MAVHDTIGDFLTIIRNGSMARRETCVASFSKMRAAIAEILKHEGFIEDVREVDTDKTFKSLEIRLKYVDGVPAITGLERHSRPGRRQYFGAREIPRILGGLGVAILTTSRGVMRAREARKNGVGGELVCKVW